MVFGWGWAPWTYIIFFTWQQHQESPSFFWEVPTGRIRGGVYEILVLKRLYYINDVIYVMDCYGTGIIQASFITVGKITVEIVIKNFGSSYIHPKIICQKNHWNSLLRRWWKMEHFLLNVKKETSELGNWGFHVKVWQKCGCKSSHIKRKLLYIYIYTQYDIYICISTCIYLFYL